MLFTLLVKSCIHAEKETDISVGVTESFKELKSIGIFNAHLFSQPPYILDDICSFWLSFLVKGV
jgi:hypothetical protein